MGQIRMGGKSLDGEALAVKPDVEVALAAQALASCHAVSAPMTAAIAAPAAPGGRVAAAASCPDALPEPSAAKWMWRCRCTGAAAGCDIGAVNKFAGCGGGKLLSLSSDVAV